MRSIPSSAASRIFAAWSRQAHDHGLEIAIDFAIQCSPDHPWIKQHPEWFDWRPDGSIRFAENPPKKYEDIVNVHFYRDALPSIWYALRDVVLFWVDQGVKVFRVDNPHTKPVPFWEWMIGEVLDRHPDVIFLAEAFTRPKMMKQLAKIGFTQSYSYFTWRNTKAELTEYLTELTQDEPKEYMRPNFFANTPDINPVFLQTSGRAGFQSRLVLAATLSTVYGIYNGFELCEGTPIPGREEYLNSEKYEIKAWDYDRPGNIRDYVTRLNRIRRENPGAAHVHQSALLQRLERPGPALRQDDGGARQHRADRGQSRSASRPVGVVRGAALGPRPAGLGGRRGRGPARWPPVQLARQGAAGLAGPAGEPLRDLAHHAAGPGPLSTSMRARRTDCETTRT